MRRSIRAAATLGAAATLLLAGVALAPRDSAASGGTTQPMRLLQITDQFTFLDQGKKGIG